MEANNSSQNENPTRRSYDVIVVGVAIFLFITTLVSIGGVFYVSDQKQKMTEIENEKQKIQTQLNEVSAELMALKNPPIMPYCSDGVKVIFGKIEFCRPVEWLLATSSVSVVTFDLHNGNSMTLSTSNLLPEDWLSEYSKGVSTDTIDRNRSVIDTVGVELVGNVYDGTMRPSSKQVVTVFTIGTATYAVLLDNNRDTSFIQNLAVYREMVNSLRTLK